MPKTERESYVVQSVVHASQILRAFQSPAELLRLRDVVQRTGFGKGMCFRLLHTLSHCGLLEKVDATQYRPIYEIRRRKRYRIGYAGQGQDSSFPHEVYSGLQAAAESEDIELIVVNNRYQPKVALRNAEHLIRERVDLVIEFQTDEAVAPAIASKYLEANIPFIAIDIPHPGGTYFGANNYQAGLLAGRCLGQWARTRWSGRVDEVVLLELARAGSLVHARMSGVLAGLRETLHEAVDACLVAVIDGDGQFKTSMEKLRRHLRESSARHVVVGAANDPSALGAVRAFQEAGRVSDLRDRRAKRGARRPCRVAGGAHAAHRVGGLLSGALRKRHHQARSRHPRPPAHTTRHLHSSSADHAGERRSRLCERRPPQ